MVSLNTLTKDDVVKASSLPDTMLSTLVGGAINAGVESFIPSISPLIKGVGMVLGGVIIGPMVGGKAGGILQNGLTITGGVKLSDWAVATATRMLGIGNSNTTTAGTTADTAVIY